MATTPIGAVNSPLIRIARSERPRERVGVGQAMREREVNHGARTWGGERTTLLRFTASSPSYNAGVQTMDLSGASSRSSSCE